MIDENTDGTDHLYCCSFVCRSRRSFGRSCMSNTRPLPCACEKSFFISCSKAFLHHVLSGSSFSGLVWLPHLAEDPTSELLQCLERRVVRGMRRNLRAITSLESIMRHIEIIPVAAGFR